MTRNLILVCLLAFVLTSATATLIYVQKKNLDPFVQTLPITNPVVQVSGETKVKIRFHASSTVEVKVNEGEQEEGPKKKPRFFSLDGETVTFNIPEEWKNRVEEIVVPEGTLIKVSSGQPINVNINDAQGNRSTNGNGSLLIDTHGADVIHFDGSSWFIEGSGSIFVLDDPYQGGDGIGEIEPPSPPSCSTGTQIIRNYCCSQLHQNQPGVSCPPLASGAWVFNNAASSCQYQCTSPDPVQGGEGGQETNCGIGAQAIRDTCCLEENVGTPHASCPGTWKYNNGLALCQYQCDDQGEQSSPPPEEGSSMDPLSQTCALMNNPEAQDECCNEALSNDLSTGPRPSFPDCLGQWVFDHKTGCAFECADHGERIEILQQLKENALSQP